MDDRFRAMVSVAIVLMGTCLGLIAGVFAESESTAQASGTVIDFGDYDTVWSETDPSEYDTAQDLLVHATSINGYPLVMSDDGTITSINGVVSGEAGSWDLWVVYPGGTEMMRLDAPYDQRPSDYTITVWAYCAEGEEPSPVVDYTGMPIYGYAQKYRVVSLTPTITEILASVKAGNIIVGVDDYSNYPASVVSRIGTDIQRVSNYANPSLEPIVGVNPDVVFCDGDLQSHVQIASQLRGVSVDAIVLYPGEDLDTVLDNIFIVGRVIGYELAAEEVIDDTVHIVDTISRMCYQSSAGGTVDVMVSLEPDISPFVSGSDTYVSDILSIVNASNVFDEWYGWVHITSDRIPAANPDKIVIITAEYSIDEYDLLYNNLSAMWKETDAWKNGEVYVICGSAAEMVQRFGPRTAQVVEVLGMMLHPDAFDTDVPKIIGDDYEDYLTYSSGMSLT